MPRIKIQPLPTGWQEQVIDIQHSAYPRCKHGTTTPFTLDGQPICIMCYTEDPALALRSRSMMLVSGGL